MRFIFRSLLLGAACAIANAAPSFVGTPACAQCHGKHASAWKGSHHDLAMQRPDAATVLGNFSTSFAKGGVTTTFAKRGDRFVIRTDGPGGKVADFEVKYVFGVSPLQQYLLEIPGGRLQAFTLAWDSRPKEQGGQRWFDLYPKEKLKAGDELHWTGRQQNWNYMCADCHSTNLVKGYDAAKDAFDTKWSELNVGCEACHGPGSDHVAWAKAGASAAKDAKKGLTVLLDERRGASWVPDAKSGIASRSAPRTTAREIEVCAQCHARRGQFAGGYHAGRAFLDHYRPALLTEGLYEADGQQRDEVYTWGSFLQSRMHAKGVTCSDCHDPHSAKPVAQGNAVCAQCHLPAKFDDPKHHFHRAGTKPAQCASCHMPTRDYMVIDARHDHSFRVPRPDLSVKLGTPNACTDCHRDMGAKWADAAIAKWYGPTRRQDKHYAEALKAARTGAADAEKRLLETVADASVAGIARATAAAALPDAISPRPDQALARLPADADALVRLASARSVSLVPPRERLATFGPLLADPYLVVRLEAVSQLAGIPRQAFAPAALAAFDRAVAEYREAQRFNAERPEAWLNLGALEARLGNAPEARSAYEKSLALDPTFIPARINLADLHRELNRNDEAEKVLREAARIAPANADARHALGLCLVRQGKRDAALAELERAAKLAPQSARYAYVHAVALYDAGRRPRAIEVLEAAHRRHPGDRDILEALAAYAEQAGDREKAQAWRRKLKQM